MENNQVVPEIRTVKIPSCAQHEGLYLAEVRLAWVCSVCGGPRGEIDHGKLSYDGSLRLVVDGWSNPCGHVDKYEACILEALENGLNQKATHSNKESE